MVCYDLFYINDSTPVPALCNKLANYYLRFSDCSCLPLNSLAISNVTPCSHGFLSLNLFPKTLKIFAILLTLMLAYPVEPT